MKIFPKSTDTSQLQTHKFYVRIKFIAFTIRPTIKRPLFEASVVLAFAQDSFSPSAVAPPSPTSMQLPEKDYGSLFVDAPIKCAASVRKWMSFRRDPSSAQAPAGCHSPAEGKSTLELQMPSKPEGVSAMPLAIILRYYNRS